MELPILPTASQHKPMIYTNCCIVYRVIPPDDEQEACSKHVEVIRKEKSNELQQCIKIFIIPRLFAKKTPTKCKNVSKYLLFHIYMKLNMFRATHSLSSGA